MSILKPMSLKILMIVFFFLSIFWPLKFPKRINPPSLNNPKLVLGSFSVFSTHISATSKLLTVNLKQISVDLFFQV